MCVCVCVWLVVCACVAWCTGGNVDVRVPGHGGKKASQTRLDAHRTALHWTDDPELHTTNNHKEVQEKRTVPFGVTAIDGMR